MEDLFEQISTPIVLDEAIDDETDVVDENVKLRSTILRMA